ncbi:MULTISPECIES: dihydrofolate reductase family protein [unclassified Nocardia]|uniref:dihydrofolate reductase family protein n=1 Tax=unclassified Nocardia TaxID=2637762 RepID=UPI0033ACB287
MGHIVVSENLSLDGVVRDPTGEEGFARGGWFERMDDATRRAWAEIEDEEARSASALLLGRRSYEWFARRWASRPGDWADRLRALPKYVVGSTVDDLGWGVATRLHGDPVRAVARLRETVDGDIVVYASRLLVHTLIDHDLVDELRLTTFPCVLGAGERLFGATGAPKTLRLAEVRTVGAELTIGTYRFAR